jgi:cytochrome c-type biogenesis protein CcmH/NrfF
MRTKGSLAVILFFFLTLLAGAGSVRAETAEQMSQHTADWVMSPYCPGRTLSACPSEEARALRSEITTWYQAGESEEGVRQKLTARFGEDLLGAPQASGFGMLGWLAPIIFVPIVGLLLAKVFFQKGKGNLEQVGASTVADERVEAEYQKFLANRQASSSNAPAAKKGGV